jgi:tetratricopeptide (TPR) repeat protein
VAASGGRYGLGVDIRRLKEQASRLSAEGRLERAEVLYRQMLTLQPRDSGLWLRHADLLKRLHRADAAVSSYRMAAQLLMDVGHGHRAVACLKQALELHPDDLDLVTEIIRYELRYRVQERERPSLQHLLAPLDAPHEPLLALPMLPPLPAAQPSAPGIPLEVEAQPRWPQVRRVSEGEVAIKPSPFSKWLVLTASTAIEVRFLEHYDVDEEALWLEEPSK